MNAEKLKRLQTQVRIGGKGTPRRKKKVMHQTAASDDKKLQSSLKKLSVSTIPGIEEVNIIKDDLTVIHFNNPKAQASLSANTFAVTGHGETKKVVEMLPEILPQLGQETVVQLRMFANSMTKNQKEGLDGQDAAALDNADDDDVPMLVSDFDEIAKKEDLRKEQMKSTAKDVDNDEKQMTAKVSNTEQHTIDIVDGSCLNKAAQSTENTAKAEVNAAKKEMTKKAGKDEHAKKEQNKPKTKNTEAQASGTQNQTNAKESAGKNAKKGAAAKESSKKTANKTEANTKQSDNVKENNKPQSAALVDTAPSPTANATAEPLKQCLNTSENNKKQEVIVEKDEGVKNLQAENTKTSKDDCEQKESIKLDNKSIESATKTNIQQQIEKKENTELQTPLPAKELKTDEGKKTEKPQTPLPSQELKTDEVKKTVKPQTLLPSQELKTDEVIKTEKPLNVEETSPTLNVSQKPNELTKNENLTEPQAKSLAISTNTPPSTNQIEAAKYELNAHKHLIELKLTDELLSLTSKSVESSKNYLKKLDDLVKDAQITAPSSEVKPMGYAEKLKAAPPPSTELPKEEPKKEDKQIKVENVKEVKEPSSMPLEKSVDLEKNKDAKEKQSSPNITAELPIQQEVPSSPSADPQVNIIDAQVMQSPIISPDIKSAQQEIKTAEHIIPKDSAFIVATEQNAITINATEIKCVQTKTLIDIENQTTGVEIMEVEAGFELPQENISSNIIKENIGDILQNIQAQADVKNSEESLDKPIATIKPMAQQEQAVPANVENLSLGNISADLPTSVDQSTLIASPPKKDSAKKDTGKTQTTPSTKSDTKKQDSGIKPKQVSPQKTATGTSSKQGVKSAPGSQSVKQEKPSTAVKPKQTTSQAKPQATTSSSPKASTPQPKKSSVSPPAEQAPKISAATKTSSPPAEQSPKLSASTKTSSPPAEQSPKTSAATKTSSPPTEQAPKISATTKTSSPPAEQSPKISAAATKTSSPPAEQSPKISAPTKTSSPPATSQATSSAKPRPSSTNTQKGAKKPKPQPEKTTPQQKATDSSPKPPSEAATPQQKPSATSPKPQTEATTPQQKS